MSLDDKINDLDQHSDVIYSETRAGRNTNQRVGLLGRKVVEIFRNFWGGAGNMFLRKDIPDIAKEEITFEKGLKSKEKSVFEKGFTANDVSQFDKGLHVGTFTPGLLDGTGGAFREVDGKSELEVHNLKVRGTATFYEVMIQRAQHVGGELINSAANMVCKNVVDFPTYWRCFFNRGENNEVINTFVINDQARCQVFLGTKQKYYWRLVVGVGVDYIDLSKTLAQAEGDRPEAGDHIFQLGNPTDKTRQNAQIFSSVGINSPSFIQYGGIDSFSLVGCERTAIVGDGSGNKLFGKVAFVSGGTVKELEDFVSQTEEKIEDSIKRDIKIEMTPEVALVQADANGNVLDNYATAKTNIRLLRAGKEIYPTMAPDAEKGNLLREFDIRFNFKYWGDPGEVVYHDPREYVVSIATESGALITSEEGKLITL